MRADLRLITDNELAERVKCYRDELAWEALQYNYWDKIYAFVFGKLKNRRLDGKDVEDVVEEIFIRVFRKIDTFKKDGNFRAWLYKIARNMCYDELKQLQGIVTIPLNEAISSDGKVQGKILIEGELTSIEDAIEEEQILVLLDDCLDELDGSFSEVVFLRIYEELNWSEISRVLQINRETVKDIFNRALQLLRICFRWKTGFGF